MHYLILLRNCANKSLEETKSEEESTEQKKNLLNKKKTTKEESKPKLEDNVFNMYILDKIEMN